MIEKGDLVEASDVIFKGNEAALGGAVYILAVEAKQSSFSDCVFAGNKAADGGAMYLYTGPGVDVFTASIFHNNFARESTRDSRVYVTELPGIDKLYKTTGDWTG